MHGFRFAASLNLFLQVCVAVWSLASESFLLPLVPDTLLISSAYIQVKEKLIQLTIDNDIIKHQMGLVLS